MLVALVLSMGLAAEAAAAGDASVPDFDREIRPLLSANCYQCHGPDENARESDLRLDRFADATADRGGYAALVPGDASGSELVERLWADDPDVVMPPPSSNRGLTTAEKRLLERWIAAGGEYKAHWAFTPPQRPAVPRAGEGWARNPIDHFVAARLESEGLSPSPEADRLTLARRISLDLVGFPPTPDEAAALAADPSEGALEAYVDRLLASPHYGERWARRWLDLARYADTNGYEKDRPRSIWPYRDWVIDALNAGMPYDEFTIKQLAGDMLPQASEADRIATGFHRNTMLNEEGGTDPLEFRFLAAVDRVGTTGATWLGMTVACAQCHTHKYDPLTHTEFYGLMALLDNVDELRIPVENHEIAAARTQQRQRIEQLRSRRVAEFPPQVDWPYEIRVEPGDGGPQIATRPSDQHDARAAHLSERLAEWIESKRKTAVDWELLSVESSRANLARLTPQPDGSLLAEGDVSKEDWYELDVVLPKGTQTLRLETLPDDRLPFGGPGRVYYEGPGGDFMLSDLSLRTDRGELAFASADATYAKTWIAKKHGAALAIDEDQSTGWSISGRPAERHVAVFRLAQPLAEATRATLRMDFFRHYAAPLGRFRWAATPAEAVASDLPHEVVVALRKERAAWSPNVEAVVREAFLDRAAEVKSLNDQIAKLTKSMPAYDTTLTLAERPSHHPRPTHRHHRGEYLSPEEIVNGTVPEALGGWPEGRTRNRLELARWLVSPENPLAARVKMNRDWAAFFGTGLVRTLEDFGLQGEPPSHPDLLDWLAVEFRQPTTPPVGSHAAPVPWDVKRMHRLIVLSATYRQQSHVTPTLLQRDPQNRLLARGPRVRLAAEQIRDSVLAVSGLLTPTIGGPSVFPPQPAAVAKENFYGKFTWETSTGPDRYRRGLYTFAKRTNPYAMFGTFDAPTGQSCVVRRIRSNTPLQALTMLNDAVVMEAAAALGQKMSAIAGDDDDRAERLLRRVLTRPPSQEERAAIVQFVSEQRDRLERGELDAESLLADGRETPLVGDRTTAAAWALAARVLLNTDEMIVEQ